MKGITITPIAALLALFLTVCGPSGTGSRQGEKDSASGLNAAQDDNRPAPGAQDVKQQVTDTQGAKQPSKDAKSPGARGVKQPVKGAKPRGKGVKRSMTDTRQDVKRQEEGIELQIIETQDVEPLAIDVMQPTEDVKALTVEFVKPSVEPMDMEDMNDSIVWPLARRINLASPARPKCSTAYETWLEIRVR